MCKIWFMKILIITFHTHTYTRAREHTHKHTNTQTHPHFCLVCLNFFRVGNDFENQKKFASCAMLNRL